MQSWSATPTPLTPTLEVDVPSVGRMIEAAVADGLHGLFMAGTCGEGPWLANRERIRLIEAASKAARGRIKIAAQVSDNSVPRIRDNMNDMAAAGADYVVIAHPPTLLNATPERVAGLFLEASTISPLPVGIYDLGSRRPLAIAEDRLESVYLHPKVEFVKDSSAAPSRRAIALSARAKRPGLKLFNGDEFCAIEYLEAGYDGFMFGGAVVAAPHLRRIGEHFAAGRLAEAKAEDEAMKAMLYGIYGGESIACWLTGLKYCLQCMGMFSTSTSFLGYPLTAECKAYIEAYVARRQRG
ncbi:MAG TPA: dihydrodipicolinate synthase family protein [Opitutaceae bacterium]|nr:dihydrodipicolinate synthase family protein [Opitutaceae bacterium]